MKTINIMTSCDGNLMKLIPIQLESINANLANKNINFYLFHDGSEISYVNELKRLKYKNIKFYDVIIEDTQLYDAIAKRGGGWCGAAYYSLCAHKYLPPEMDRIWYIDAGDVLVVGDVDDYYFTDFEDKSIIATSILFKVEADKKLPFIRDDLFNKNYLAGIARGIFNSGSYVMNLNKLRKINYNINNYVQWAEMIYESRGKLKKTFFGDQGFMSLVFVGDIKFFARSKEMDLFYMPYNFGLWYFDKSPQPLDYKPSVVHFVGDRIFKPWKGKYSKFLKRFQVKDELHEFDNLSSNQISYYETWYKYALMADNKLNLYESGE